MFNIEYNLILVEAMKYVKLQRDCIHLQQILANKKYYEISFFPHTVKDWDSVPEIILAVDCLQDRGY